MKKLVMVLCLVLIGSLVVCGGGSNPPIYNDLGECVANCDWDAVGEDGFSQDNGQDLAGQDNPLPMDCAVAGDQNACDVPVLPDLGHFVCPEPNNPPEFCKPSVVKGSICAFSEWEGKVSCTYGSPKAGESCSTDEECQFLPVEDYPPCACWGKVVCVLGDIQKYTGNPVMWRLEDSLHDFYWEIKQEPAGQYCKLIIYDTWREDDPWGQKGAEDNPFYFSPEWNYLRRPAPEQGPMETKITLLESENQFLVEHYDEEGNITSSKTYNKMEE